MTNKPMKWWWAAELIADFPGRPAGSRWKQVVLSSDHDAAARGLMDELARVKGALRDLVEQVDSLEGYQLTRDIDPHEAQATWDDVLERVNRVCKEMK